METFQRMTTGKQVIMYVSVHSERSRRVDRLTERVRDHIDDAGDFEKVVGLLQNWILRTHHHCVVDRVKHAMELHQPNANRSTGDGEDEHGPPKDEVRCDSGSKAFEE